MATKSWTKRRSLYRYCTRVPSDKAGVCSQRPNQVNTTYTGFFVVACSNNPSKRASTAFRPSPPCQPSAGPKGASLCPACRRSPCCLPTGRRSLTNPDRLPGRGRKPTRSLTAQLFCVAGVRRVWIGGAHWEGVEQKNSPSSRDRRVLVGMDSD